MLTKLLKVVSRVQLFSFRPFSLYHSGREEEEKVVLYIRADICLQCLCNLTFDAAGIVFLSLLLVCLLHLSLIIPIELVVDSVSPFGFVRCA